MYDSLATLALMNFIHSLDLHVPYYGEVKMKECEVSVVSHRGTEQTHS